MLLKKNDRFLIIDRNKEYRVKGFDKLDYLVEDEKCELLKYGITGIDNAIEKSKSVIKL